MVGNLAILVEVGEVAYLSLIVVVEDAHPCIEPVIDVVNLDELILIWLLPKTPKPQNFLFEIKLI